MMSNEVKIKVITFFSSIIFSFLWSLSPAFAHVLRSDATVGAVLHLHPSDAPVTNKETIFTFMFQDKKRTFSLADCLCTVTLTQNNSSIYTTTLTKSPTFSYMFSNPGAYTVSVKGSSLTNHFKPFTLSYIFRVENAGVMPQNQATLNPVGFHLLHYGIFVIGFIVLIGFLIREKKKARR